MGYVACTRGKKKTHTYTQTRCFSALPRPDCFKAHRSFQPTGSVHSFRAMCTDDCSPVFSEYFYASSWRYIETLLRIFSHKIPYGISLSVCSQYSVMWCVWNILLVSDSCPCYVHPFPTPKFYKFSVIFILRLESLRDWLLYFKPLNATLIHFCDIVVDSFHITSMFNYVLSFKQPLISKILNDEGSKRIISLVLFVLNLCKFCFLLILRQCSSFEPLKQLL